MEIKKRYKSWSFMTILLVALTLPIFAFADTACTEGWVADGGTVKSGKFNLNFRVEGSGEPTIVIGLPNFYARTFSRELRSHLRMAFVDHRGSAATPEVVTPAEDYDMNVVVDDIELMRKAVEMDKVTIIGQGGHAYLAMEYAIKYPNSVSHVVMIGMPWLEAPREARDQTFEKGASAERKAILAENRANKNLADGAIKEIQPDITWFVRDAPMIFADARYNSTPLWKGIAYDGRFLGHLWQGTFPKIDVFGELKKVKVPVAVIAGPYDFDAPPRKYWDRLKEISNAELIYLEDAGHVPNVEQPKEFDEKLLTWLNKK
jgi:proline iminopeptidase